MAGKSENEALFDFEIYNARVSDPRARVETIANRVARRCHLDSGPAWIDFVGRRLNEIMERTR